MHRPGCNPDEKTSVKYSEQNLCRHRGVLGYDLRHGVIQLPKSPPGNSDPLVLQKFAKLTLSPVESDRPPRNVAQNAARSEGSSSICTVV